MNSKDQKDERITIDAAEENCEAAQVNDEVMGENEETAKYEVNFRARGFDYDEELEKIKSAIKKPNILIAPPTHEPTKGIILSKPPVSVLAASFPTCEAANDSIDLDSTPVRLFRPKALMMCILILS